jgi:hypothetical protein
MGFQMTWPYAVSAAAAVKMPSRPTMAVIQMISNIAVGMCGGELTEDDGNNEGLDILSAGFVGVPREIGNVQAQGCIITQDSVEIWKRNSG